VSAFLSYQSGVLCNGRVRIMTRPVWPVLAERENAPLRLKRKLNLKQVHLNLRELNTIRNTLVILTRN
jgi:hypothetical protein